MKRLFTLSFALLLFSSSQSPEKKAQEYISAYITSKMDDPKSYESASFGKLEPYKEELQYNPEFIKLYVEYEKRAKLETDAYAQTLNSTDNPRIIQLANEIYESRKDSSKIALDNVQKYKVKFKADDIFSMRHTFRGKNKMGALVLDSCVAIVNKEYKVKYLK